MTDFDLYNPAGTQSKTFFDGATAPGTLVWLDDFGFRENFFADHQTKDLLQFIVMTDPNVPRAREAFEKMPFVEAEIVEQNEKSAKVVIRSSMTLGEWARAARFFGKPGLDQVPEDRRPSKETLTPLLESLRSQEGALWAGDGGAVYLFKGDTDKRAIILTKGKAYLLKL